MSVFDIPLPRPRDCGHCLALVRRARARRRRPVVRTINIQTWCRLCGRPALFSVMLDYELAIRQFAHLHNQAMAHEKGDHVETGGWGTHWRLDHVLARAFPLEYAEDDRKPFWPPPTYQPLSEDMAISLVHGIGEGVPLADARETMRSRLDNYLTRHPYTRDELERSQREVWSELELHRDFEVVGFTPPFVLVVRRRDGKRGTVMFQRNPPLYWGFDDSRII